jgi:fatty-acyl-CoA synthase
VDRDGNVVPTGTAGELCTKGYNVMTGYWNDPDKTNQVLKDEWMHTGDLAVIDDDGYCSIVGRKKVLGCTEQAVP